MIPLFVMLVVILATRAAGALGVESMSSWLMATRIGLAAMFVVTGAAHFGSLRQDLMRMVPPRFSDPAALVTLTGIAELAGAAGLLLPVVSRWAAAGLAILLVAVFPANVHAARSGATLGGGAATPLPVRLPLQLLWIGLLIWVAAG